MRDGLYELRHRGVGGGDDHEIDRGQAAHGATHRSRLVRIRFDGKDERGDAI